MFGERPLERENHCADQLEKYKDAYMLGTLKENLGKTFKQIFAGKPYVCVSMHLKIHSHIYIFFFPSKT